jgi:hypothetical protein
VESVAVECLANGGGVACWLAAHLARNPPIGNPQPQRYAKFLEKIWVSAVGPGVDGAEIIPTREAVACADNIDGGFVGLEGGCSLVYGVEEGGGHLLIQLQSKTKQGIQQFPLKVKVA